MRKFIPLATVISLVLAVSIFCLGAGLAAAGPFKPGDTLFPAQDFAERQGAKLILSDYYRSSYYLDLTDRRSLDLVVLAGDENQRLGLEALQGALQDVETSLGSARLDDRASLAARLGEVAGHAMAALSRLQGMDAEDTETLAAVRAQVVMLNQLAMQARNSQAHTLAKAKVLLMLPFLSTSRTLPDFSLDPRAINFPPGSAGAEHAFFPLVGEHAQLDCEGCHVEGKFAGTASECSACHSNVKPVNHYLGDCAACHSAFSWTDVNIDHSLIGSNDCLDCHLDEKPANHYIGQCSSCHNTVSWSQANFNHAAARATDCQSCHNRPANHFSGQCSSCHNTRNWSQAHLDHTGLTDCRDCHLSDRPANHFDSQCSDCHDTSDWNNAEFDHSGQTNCQSCHNRPAGHYSGQCSNCHGTNSWRGANFDHSGQTDCQSCHNRPAGHASGQCSNCHSTNSWGGANFDHSGQTDCQSCHNRPSGHYSGQCSNCHNTNNWGDANFDHSGQNDCQSCHNRPSGHYPGQCSNCHNTNGWGNVNFSHEGLNDCQSCHNPPSEHPSGQCSNCHDTNGWDDSVSDDATGPTALLPRALTGARQGAAFQLFRWLAVGQS